MTRPHMARLSSAKTRLILTAALCGVAASASGALAWLAAAGKSTPAPPAHASDERTEVEAVTATPFGFEPAEITRPRGRFALALHNRSGEPRLSLSLARLRDGGRLKEVRLSPRGRRRHEDLDLPPGQYVLTEAGHPGWRCLITITH